MRIVNLIIKGVVNPRRIIVRVWVLCSRFIKSDKLYLKIYYKLKMQENLDFNNTLTYTQKIQWLKLYNNTALCTKMVDKYEVREIIKDKIGDKYLIPLIGVWDSFNEIDFESLPDKFVLKTTHDSGTVVVCKDKTKFDFKKVKRKINRSLKRNYFWNGREYPYKNVNPRIIAEKFMYNDDYSDISDYKFFCFNGIPRVLFYASERFNARNEPAKFDYYDMDLNHLEMRSKGHENSKYLLHDVANFDLMKELAKTLSMGFPHLRVDFYLINGEIYFGELTFHHDGGVVPFIPSKWDRILGDMIKLPLNNIK